MLNGITSLLLLLSLLTVRALIIRMISKNPTLWMEAKRRWVVSVRNTMVFVLLVRLVVIWAHELQALAVSLVALAAALVLATKELILCWSGSALRIGGKVYSVSDRIQIAGHRGVVLDHDIFATKLLEIGPGQASHLYTGRVTVFPNSLLFTNTLVKENLGQEYGLYILVIPLRDKDGLAGCRTAPARRIQCRMCSLYGRSRSSDEVVGVDESARSAVAGAPRHDPIVRAGTHSLVLRFPAPDRGRSRIEQTILRRFLSVPR
ncbi:MAG: hypothetical protein ACREIJ_08390 [Nitrospiraceae bacterium]